VGGAVQHYREARVKKFLPVLLERRAAAAVEAAIDSGDAAPAAE